jgi:hypothetical protein
MKHFLEVLRERFKEESVEQYKLMGLAKKL